MHAKPSKLCVACRADLRDGASLCSTCKSYQRPWKNRVQYFAGVITLVSLSVTAITWVSDKVYMARFAHEDIHLVECNSLEAAVIVNRGSAEAYLSHLLLWMNGQHAEWVAQQLEINERVSPGQFLKREFYPARIKNNAIFVRGLDDDQFQRLVARAAAGDPCVEPVFYQEGDSGLRELLAFAGRSPHTFVVAGYLEYWGYRGTSLSRIPIKGTGVLRVDSRRECMDSVEGIVGTKNFF